MEYSQRQQLFDKVFILSQGLGFRTFDSLPGVTEYPFVVINEPTLNSQYHGKFRIAGELLMSIHVWGHQQDKGAHDLIMYQLEQELMKLKRLDTVYLRLVTVTPSVNKVTEGNERLLHGVIDVTYQIY